MDPEYAAAKASMEAAGGIDAIGGEWGTQGGISVADPIESTPDVSTTEVEPKTEETTTETPATEPSEPAPEENQGAPKVEAPKTEAQQQEKKPSKYQQAQREAREAKQREVESIARLNKTAEEKAREAQYWRDVAEGRVPAPEREPTEPVFISPLDGKKYTASQLREAEALFLEQGRDEDAANAGKIAEHLEGTTAQRQQQEFAQQQHFQNWQQNMEYATRIDPSLLDPKNPLTTEISQLLDYPDPLVKSVFEQHPHGFYLATEVAKVRLAASTAQAEVERLKAELAKTATAKTNLEQKILPRSAPASGRPGEKILTEEEQMAAARADYNSRF